MSTIPLFCLRPASSTVLPFGCTKAGRLACARSALGWPSLRGEYICLGSVCRVFLHAAHVEWDGIVVVAAVGVLRFELFVANNFLVVVVSCRGVVVSGRIHSVCAVFHCVTISSS